jgi:hypothetical protein
MNLPRSSRAHLFLLPLGYGAESRDDDLMLGRGNKKKYWIAVLPKGTCSRKQDGQTLVRCPCRPPRATSLLGGARPQPDGRLRLPRTRRHGAARASSASPSTAFLFCGLHSRRWMSLEGGNGDSGVSNRGHFNFSLPTRHFLLLSTSSILFERAHSTSWFFLLNAFWCSSLRQVPSSLGVGSHWLQAPVGI